MRKKIFFLLILVFCSLIIIQLSKNLWGFYVASQRINKEKEKIAQLTQKNEELREKLKEIQTEEFVEREARDSLGLAKEGETVVVIEEESITGSTGTTSITGGEDLPVWRQWVRLFWEGE